MQTTNYKREDGTHTGLPRQKIPRREKTEAWMEECADACISYVNIYSSTSRRSSFTNKIRNYKLYNNEIDRSDFEHITNPYKIKEFSLPATIQPYDIVSPMFNLLFGEESKRSFTPVIRAMNAEAITQKQEEYKKLLVDSLEQMLTQKLMEMQGQKPSEEKIQTPEQVTQYMRYTYKDIREKIANHIYSYLNKYLRLPQIFQEGWKDALIGGEEIYHIDEVSGEPVVRRCNPLELHYVLPHNSDYVDEAEIIVEQTEMSISKVIDEFYEDLTEAQIDDLEQGTSGSNFTFPITPAFAQATNVRMANDFVTSNSPANIKVYRCTWKSKRKMQELTYIDPITGKEEKDWVDEDFKIQRGDKTKTLQPFWINEYYETVRLGRDIYIKKGPKKNQFRVTENHAKAKSGYVGTVYNATNATSVSLMDRVVPWVYIYLTVWYRTELLLAANMGKIAEIDLANIPDGWEIEKWLHYMGSMRIVFKDSFSEGKKGSATGKLAGNMGHSGNGTLDLELGNSIQHHITTLQFIEKKLKDTAGVTDQRLGEISSSELVGNTERAVVQSSHITEKWFEVHNFTKLRVIETMIEVAKNCWRDNTKKLQYVTDDMGTVFLEIDGNILSDAEYGIFATDSNKDQLVLEQLKNLTQAAMQNDKMTMSEVADVFTSESIADIKNKLKRAEELFFERQQAMAEQQQKADAEREQMQQAHEQMVMENDNWNKQADRDNKIQLEILKAEAAAAFKAGEDLDNDSVPDFLESGKLALEQSRLAFEQREADRLHKRESRSQDLEEKKLKVEEKLKEKEIAVKKIAAKKKPSSPKK